MKFSIKKSILGVVLAATIVAATIVAAIPAFAANTSLTLQSKSVANGATFDVTLTASSDVATAGGQAYITFDPSKFTCNSAIYSGSKQDTKNLASYFGANEYDVSPTIDNTNGKINALTSNTGGPTTVTGTGVWVTLNFTAKTAAADSINTISLVSGTSSLADATPNWITTTLTNGTIIVGNLPQPDLTPINVSTSGVTGNLSNYTVSFNVQNLGNLASPAATTANIYVDGSTTAATTVPILVVPGTSTSSLYTSSAITISGNSDSVVVQIVPVSGETNTSNNTSTPITYVYQAPPTGNPVTVDGSIGLAFSFTPPSAIQFGPMHVGNNQVQDTNMNVTGNESWQITVQGLAPDPNMTTGYDGKMTKNVIVAPATTASYPSNPYVRLTNPLQIGANTPIVGSSVSGGAVSLDGTIQNLGGGTPATQSGAAGLTMTTTFTQNVTSSDAYLATGFDYHIVVNFVCTPTGGI